ncbi:DNA-binding response regulator, NarL/FixJ family, contains REC and HTH domains [Saccharopolyspora antimicrobica]|uniref:DNA-binding response regulator, NarL/FixJ family, contains REC and HTH domains n=1 Tax=Saccharopolyspora antimicrobica TaxID=455193 RepID=A0A1I4QLS1_9PSEU|nr:response regulator transcription factor [Saccharopolyspora antimicrobica]RKT88394.1 LuxR family two component transcriptional regulator [Saccharopolyspora antimicrobica]SFM40706.1 DNA-binding response regulator, NarL/FixJ family, contains REC and HTH domains [Saccharopolyspora antimicrobica]
MDTVNEPVRVVVVDDDPMVRRGLRMLIGGPAVQVVAEAGDGDEAVRVVAEHTPDVVLMDLRMPGTDGVVATERIRSTDAAPPVLVLTTLDSDRALIRALRAGASGFLLKDAPPDELVEGILAVHQRRPRLSDSVTRRLIDIAANGGDDDVRRRAGERVAALSDREREVAIAISRGLTNTEIAENLFMSISNVKAIVGRVMAKLDASNRVLVANTVRDAKLEDDRLR